MKSMDRKDSIFEGPGAGLANGFTLLDLLVVMVLIGLLATFVAPRYFAQVGKTQVKVARAQIDALDKALDQFRIDVGHYPTSEEELVVPPSGEPNWRGPYLKKGVPADPWGRPVHPALPTPQVHPK